MTTLDQTMKNLAPEAVANLIEHQINELFQARKAAQDTLNQIDTKLDLLVPALAALRPGPTPVTEIDTSRAGP